jgi:nitroreductase
MYDAMGIERQDKIGRAMAMAANFRGFGAPVMLFVHCPRFMGPPQWADMGIWLQSVMLLCREAGLDTCPQEAWANFGQTVRGCLGLGEEQILYTGLAIGWRDAAAAVNNFPVERAPLDEVVSWHGF